MSPLLDEALVDVVGMLKLLAKDTLLGLNEPCALGLVAPLLAFLSGLLPDPGESTLLLRLGVLLSDPGELTVRLLAELPDRVMLEKLLCLDRVPPLKLLPRLGIELDVLEYIELTSARDPEVREPAE